MTKEDEIKPKSMKLCFISILFLIYMLMDFTCTKVIPSEYEHHNPTQSCQNGLHSLCACFIFFFISLVLLLAMRKIYQSKDKLFLKEIYLVILTGVAFLIAYALMQTQENIQNNLDIFLNCFISFFIGSFMAFSFRNLAKLHSCITNKIKTELINKLIMFISGGVIVCTMLLYNNISNVIIMIFNISDYSNFFVLFSLLVGFIDSELANLPSE